MTITSFSVLTHCNDLGGRFRNPAFVWKRKHAVFVVLTDAEGRTGLGECWCFDSEPDALVAFLRSEVAPSIVSVPVAEVSRRLAPLLRLATLTARHGILCSAISGVDIAAWDLRAQASGQPLWREFGSQDFGSAIFYASGGLYGQGEPGEAGPAAEMTRMWEAGFPILKMKIGGLDPELDLARIASVLDALPRAKLIIDGVYSYDSDAALDLFSRLPAGRIEAFQSPVPAADWAGMRRLTTAGVPVMAVEAEYRPEIHEVLIATRAVRFLQVAPVACGGPSRVLALADRLADTEVRLSLEVSSTAVATLAAGHLAAARPDIAHVEYHMLHQVFFDQLELPLCDRKEGRRLLPIRPGLGISLAPDAAEPAFTLKSPGK